jgi:hypothetical protein
MADEEFEKALEASPEIELTLTGRTSGREISTCQHLQSAGSRRRRLETFRSRGPDT